MGPQESLYPTLCWERQPGHPHPAGLPHAHPETTSYLPRRELFSARSRARHAHTLQHRSQHPPSTPAHAACLRTRSLPLPPSAWIRLTALLTTPASSYMHHPLVKHGDAVRTWRILQTSKSSLSVEVLNAQEGTSSLSSHPKRPRSILPLG